MNWRGIFHILGGVVAVFCVVQLIPLFVALLLREETVQSFLFSLLVSLGVVALLWLFGDRIGRDLRIREGFLIIALFWLLLSFFGSLPFLFDTVLNLSFTDALFESISGLTTTGATVLSGLDDLPRSILLYRSLLQWLGGICIVLIAITILPRLGIGGLQIYRNVFEGSGENKLAPHIKESAKLLFIFYFVLSIVCMMAYWLAGMSVFDAICHGMSTVAIGGFSTHDESIGYFQQPSIWMVGIIFMVIAGINFTAHLFAWNQLRVYRTQRGSLKKVLKNSFEKYSHDIECPIYLLLLIILVIFACGWMAIYPPDKTAMDYLKVVFQAISLATTTGYTVADFSYWPTLLPFLLLMMGFIGGCYASTAGGVKIFRIVFIAKQGIIELRRLIHPRGVFLLKMGGKSVSERIVHAVWGFIAIYLLTFMALLMGVLATGLDFTTAFSAVGANLNNIGPGLGDVAVNYADIPMMAKWILSCGMLLGRLEIFTLVVILTPMFWRL